MRHLLTLVLSLGLLSCKNSENNKRELLENTWLPILQQYDDGDTSLYELPRMLLTFEANGSGRMEYTGTEVSNSFTYDLKDDTLFMGFPNGLDTAILKHVNRDQLKIYFGAYNILTFIPLQEIDLEISTSDIDEQLKHGTWKLEYMNEYEEEYLIEFLDILRDSSLVGARFYDQIRSFNVYPNIAYNTYDDVWAVNEHQNTHLLGLERIFNSFPPTGTYLVQEAHEDTLHLKLWERGEIIDVLLTKVNKISQKAKGKLINNLTGHRWRIQDEIILPIDTTGVLMDLGMAPDDFEELEDFDLPPYLHDSTLLVTQDDIKLKTLVLDFEQSGGYRVFRNSRVLDEGRWELQFESKIIVLQSNRIERSDGLIRGYIEIDEITENHFQLRRNWLSRLDYHESWNLSFSEIYAPIK